MSRPKDGINTATNKWHITWYNKVKVKELFEDMPDYIDPRLFHMEHFAYKGEASGKIKAIMKSTLLNELRARYGAITMYHYKNGRVIIDRMKHRRIEDE